jgi:hypothetical protein
MSETWPHRRADRLIVHHPLSVIFVVTVFLCDWLATLASRAIGKIDRSIAIVVEDAQNRNRANFPLKSKAKKFDGLTVGFRPSAESFCV